MSLEVETETPTFYSWEVAGKPISIRLDFGVIDQVLSEVMQGFGSVPRRGAEVGGLLLGTVEPGEPAVVHIQDFDPVYSDHARGPSYLLSAADEERLKTAIDRWRPESARNGLQIVGLYRSHTRDGVLSLAEEDLMLFERYFPGPDQVFLTVKPYAARASVGAFFFREEGLIRGDSSYLEFPFRRRDLGGGIGVSERATGPASRPNGGPPEPSTSPVDPDPPPPRRSKSLSLFEVPPSSDMPLLPPPTETPKPKRNVWIPLSFMFLLVGVLLGFQTAISLRPAASASASRDPYMLSLAAAKSEETINLKWDRQSPAILRARSGVLSIGDGSYAKSLELDSGQLLNGTVVYRYLTAKVVFRLEVFSQDRTSVVETVEVHTGAASAAAGGDDGSISSAKAK